MFKMTLVALLAILPVAANAAEMNIAATAQESDAYSNMDGAQRYALLEAVMKRGCPVRPPQSMTKEESIKRLNGFAPLSAALMFMRNDCKNAIAAQTANQPAVVHVTAKKH
jgi:hypothetical protein